MINASRCGLTRIEWIVVVLIMIAVVSLLQPAVTESRRGTFAIRCNIEGTSPTDTSLRIIVGSGSNIADSIQADSYAYRTSRDVERNETSVDVKGMFRKQQTQLVLITLRSEILLDDAVIAEYSAPTKLPKYRVIPFQRVKGQETVELAIPREPPNEMEAWRPTEGTGR